jgi:hypothetical protein
MDTQCSRFVSFFTFPVQTLFLEPKPVISRSLPSSCESTKEEEIQTSRAEVFLDVYSQFSVLPAYVRACTVVNK